MEKKEIIKRLINFLKGITKRCLIIDTNNTEGMSKLALNILVIILVVVVLPLVPVTNTTLYPLDTVAKMLLSNFNATLPGKVVPPFKMVLVRNNVNFVANILRIDLILIFFTTYNSLFTLLTIILNYNHLIIILQDISKPIDLIIAKFAIRVNKTNKKI